MNPRLQPSSSLFAAIVLCHTLAAAPQVPWATTERASVSSTGAEANGVSITNSNTPLAISADGRCVAFNSAATNLVTGDTNGAPDLFLRDVLSGTTERVSVSSSGVQGNADNYGRGSYGAALSADGRFVAFYSYSSNLVAGDNGGNCDVFVRDRLNGTTELVSISTSGNSPNGVSNAVSISGDGRYVVFTSTATNLVASDRNKAADVFVRDRLTNTTRRASVTDSGAEGKGNSTLYFCGNAISADGRYVLFMSQAANLVVGDTNGENDAFVRDLVAGTTTRVSVGNGGAQANGGSWKACLSGDGRYVAFTSNAGNLLPSGAPAGSIQLFVRDRVNLTTQCVSVSSSGQPADNSVNEHAALSADGRYVVFVTAATNLVSGDTGGYDVFVRDTLLATTTRISPSGSSFDGSGFEVAIDAGGLTLAFASQATDLVAFDTNGVKDVFVVR